MWAINYLFKFDIVIQYLLDIKNQKHFRCTILIPVSIYSVLEIHMAVKVASELKIDPPIHVRNLLSAGSVTLIFVPPGKSELSYLDSLSPVPA